MTRALTKIPAHVSFRLRYLFQDKGIGGKELLKLYPEYSKKSLSVYCQINRINPSC